MGRAAPAGQAEPRERQLLLLGEKARSDDVVDEDAAQLGELLAIGQVLPAALGELVRAAEVAAGGVQHRADTAKAQQALWGGAGVGQEGGRGQERLEVVMVLG